MKKDGKLNQSNIVPMDVTGLPREKVSLSNPSLKVSASSLSSRTRTPTESSFSINSPTVTMETKSHPRPFMISIMTVKENLNPKLSMISVGMPLENSLRFL